MPEYLAPGVFVEETSFRSKSIEGVSTSTTAFVGPTRSGPVDDTPELLTSFADFERIYGGVNDLGFADERGRKTNYLAHGVSAYFNEGGARLYVSRACAIGGGGSATAASGNLGTAGDTIQFVARFRGAIGNGVVSIEETTVPTSINGADKVPNGSVIRVKSATPALFLKRNGAWLDNADAAKTFGAADEASGMELVTLAVSALDNDQNVLTYEDLGYDPAHPRFIGSVLAETPSRRADQLTQLYALKVAGTVTAFDIQTAFAPAAGEKAKVVKVGTGLDGVLPTGATAGTDVAPAEADYKRALNLVEAIDDVSIVAAPGYSAYAATRESVALDLIAHAEKRRSYRIAVLDTNSDLTVSQAQTVKAKVDSKYAALYYPWVVTPNPLASSDRPEIPKEITLPPSAFVCGIYARSDIERGVFKAPANEVIRSALRFERLISTGEQELLNPLGVNCLRYFAGRGYRVWGARTISSDPEWKYVNVRRYFNYLEHSIDRGTQWAVFEPNGERLWANVRDTVSGFLYNEWFNSALLGDKPEQAYFVKCDRSTMTQNDLDNGRLVCLIGVAVIKPAEFVIFRIGQKTADARS